MEGSKTVHASFRKVYLNLTATYCKPKLASVNLGYPRLWTQDLKRAGDQSYAGKFKSWDSGLILILLSPSNPASLLPGAPGSPGYRKHERIYLAEDSQSAATKERKNRSPEDNQRPMRRGLHVRRYGSVHYLND
jgi:hypothetical protein